MDNQNKITEIIEENRRRNAELAREFDPVSGMGSTGSRFRVGVSDIERGALWLPESMRTLPEIKILDECGSMREYARRLCGHEPSMRERELAADSFLASACASRFPVLGRHPGLHQEQARRRGRAVPAQQAAAQVCGTAREDAHRRKTCPAHPPSRPGNGEGAPAPSFTWHGCSLCTAKASTRL